MSNEDFSELNVSEGGPWETQNEAKARQHFVDLTVDGEQVEELWVDLPDEKEVLDTAIASRASNKAQKLERLSDELYEKLIDVLILSDEVLTTTKELDVLMAFLGEDRVKELSESKLGRFAEIQDPNKGLDKAGKRLQYSGLDLLLVYARLKAVFDIDNERPSYEGVSFTHEEMVSLTEYLTGRRPGTGVIISDLKKLERKQWPLDKLEPRGTIATPEIERLKEKYRLYVEGKIKASK